MPPSRSNKDEMRESVPRTMVYSQISGSQMRYERIRESQDRRPVDSSIGSTWTWTVCATLVSHALPNFAPGQQAQGLSYNVNRTGDYYHAGPSGQQPCAFERGLHRTFLEDFSLRGLGEFGDLLRRSRAWVVGAGCD